jgi:hypothetical protein
VEAGREEIPAHAHRRSVEDRGIEHPATVEAGEEDQLHAGLIKEGPQEVPGGGGHPGEAIGTAAEAAGVDADPHPASPFRATR